MRQMSIFDGSQPLKITKPIRLIECFAGYGSQALALKYLGVGFEHWKIAEWAVKSIQAYKDMHFPDDNTDYSAEYSKEWLIDYLFAKGISADYNKPMTREQITRMGEGKIRKVYNNIIATHNLVSVTNVKGKDLQINDTDDYTYILTYSFPCQDLSQAGLSKGMQKGSGTRSGLLWEIERILDECEELPQILLLENVPQVIGEKNRDAFRDWFMKLESLGYKSWYAIMNGKDYGTPQNRERCFMVSALGDYYYEFPQARTLKSFVNDYLEKNVEHQYYLTLEQLVYCFDCKRVCDNTKRGDLGDRIVNPQVCKTISCRGAESQRADITNFVVAENNIEYSINEIRQVAIETIKNSHLKATLEKTPLGDKILSIDCYNRTAYEEVCQTIKTTFSSNNENFLYDLCGIRKYTPKECFRLMGVKDEDFERVSRNQSNSSLYHLAGDSIITNCLMAIFKEML
ncbi:MAG: DNA (cytosine-5-)-methyltransferase [Clostridia bacterium]|nr:DNA (cytosine-5-)-methyltransferase [Clostridia bacterium]